MYWVFFGSTFFVFHLGKLFFSGRALCHAIHRCSTDRSRTRKKASNTLWTACMKTWIASKRSPTSKILRMIRKPIMRLVIRCTGVHQWSDVLVYTNDLVYVFSPSLPLRGLHPRSLVRSSYRRFSSGQIPTKIFRHPMVEHVFFESHGNFAETRRFSIFGNLKTAKAAVFFLVVEMEFCFIFCFFCEVEDWRNVFWVLMGFDGYLDFTVKEEAVEMVGECFLNVNVGVDCSNHWTHCTELFGFSSSSS